MSRIYATKDATLSEREVRNMERARRIAAQGMVLLQNDGVLPLSADGRKLALFGNGARMTVKGGTGSGDVNSRFVVNVEQGLEEAGYVVTTKSWLDRYDKVVEEAKRDYFTTLKQSMKQQGPSAIMELFNNPFKEPPINVVTKEDLNESDTDTAIYVLSRNSGEGKDRRPVAGEYELYEEEKEAIASIASAYAQVIVVLNVGCVIDTAFLRGQKGVNAILLMSQAGNIGGRALVDVLTGKVNPSGCLTSTWAMRYGDYPGADSYSHMNGNVDDEYYEEGIFVGYRYFDTFGVNPAYPFGYGLSYTNFSIETDNITVCEGQVTASVKVANIGNRTGRKVVQVYYSAPDGRLEKPWQELCAYAKTKELVPGESQTLALSWPVNRMASYDTDSASWVLEAGDYYVRVGSHSRDTHVAAVLVVQEQIVTEKLSNRLKSDVEMKQLTKKGAAPYTYGTEETEKAAAPRIMIDPSQVESKTACYRQGEILITADKQGEDKITADDVRAGRATVEELVSQLTVTEMAELCVGSARGGFGSDSVIGAASAVCPGAAGDTTSRMVKDRNIRNMILADGPAGLRLSRSFLADSEGIPIPGVGDAPIPGMECLLEDMPKPKVPEEAVRYYQYCTAIPIATLLAQTWDVGAVKEAGDIVGEEMEELGVTLWLAPGMNIHRNPLCGRNFEYYSEDPLVSGLCAAADTCGVQAHSGVGTTIKHFAFNNQEDNRMHTNAHIGERAIREIYLKGFEIAVKESQPMSIMTSYNLINGIHTANSHDLLTSIARDEWGFKGIIMTDWGTTGSMEMNSDKTLKYGCAGAAACIKAGNDLIMPGSQKDVDEIVSSIGAAESSGVCSLKLEELQACAVRMLQVILSSAAYENT